MSRTTLFVGPRKAKIAAPVTATFYVVAILPDGTEVDLLFMKSDQSVRSYMKTLGVLPENWAAERVTTSTREEWLKDQGLRINPATLLAV